jgi:hypothetical protein
MLQKCSYVAMTFCYSPEHRVLARVLPWLAIGDFHHITHHVKYKCFMPEACVDSSLLKPYIQQAILSLYQNTKHESPPLSIT